MEGFSTCGAGHRFFSALALANKAEAHMRLGQFADARAAVADAEAICEALGSVLAALPQILYGELYRQRGDVVRARGSFERARALAEESGDAHILVFALCGLARVLAADDLAAARKAAADSVAQPAAPATSAPAAASGPLSGKWNGQYGGSYQGTFVLHWLQAGSKLNGHINISAPPSTLPIHGSVNGTSIQFGTVGSYAITYTGTVSGNSMSGTYKVGSVQGGNWSASKG